jgi:hypothetical protein
VAATQAQGDHPPDIDLVGRGTGTTENDLIEIARGERLANQQGASGLYRQITRCERPWRIAPLEERRSRAVHDVYGLESHLLSFV